MNDMQIQCFLEAAEVENFTKAAEKLYMAQPALSRNIAALENEIGVQLFTRERKSVRLSEAGRICFEAFKHMAEEFGDMRSQAMAAQRKIGGDLLIGSAYGLLVGEYYSESFNYMLKNYPNINFKLEFYTLSEMKKGLANGSIDIALIAESELDEIRDEVEYRELRRGGSRLVVPTDHRLASKKDLKLSDFATETFLVLDSQESKKILNYDSLIQRFGNRIKYKVAPDIGTLALWLESGVGVSILSEWHSLRNSRKLSFLEVPGLIEVVEAAAWKKNNTNEAIPIFLHALVLARQKKN